MTMRSAPRAVSRKYLENARYAVTLGAAFALLCAVVLDPQESSAAGGFLELLFGAFNAQQAAPDYGYSNGGAYSYGRTYNRRRHVRRAPRANYAHVRRHNVERRAQWAATAERRAAAERRAERRQQRIAEIRAAERRRVAVERRANARRFAEAKKGWREAATRVENISTPATNTAPVANPAQVVAVVKNASVPPATEQKSPAKRAANGQYVPRAIVNPTQTAATKAMEPATKVPEQQTLAPTPDNVPLPPQIDRNVSESPKAEASAQDLVTMADTPATNSTNSVVSRRPVCVRACDGYYFPIANKATEISAQQSCENLCPGAQTRVFMMPGGSMKIEEAVAAQGGETYAQFVAKLNPDDAKSKNCACPTKVGNLTETGAFLSDLTLRPGDTVVTPDGVRVVRRGSHYPFKKADFLSLAESQNVSPAKRGALAAIEKAMKTPYGRLAVASNSDRRRHRHAADL